MFLKGLSIVAQFSFQGTHPNRVANYYAQLSTARQNCRSDLFEAATVLRCVQKNDNKLADI
jgi:hypothetical protein